MRVCNSCNWSGAIGECVMLGAIGPLCPECNETTFEGRPHNYDDEGVCMECGLDGAEAAWYSKRGYAHEYPTLNDCPGGISTTSTGGTDA